MLSVTFCSSAEVNVNRICKLNVGAVFSRSLKALLIHGPTCNGDFSRNIVREKSNIELRVFEPQVKNSQHVAVIMLHGVRFLREKSSLQVVPYNTALKPQVATMRRTYFIAIFLSTMLSSTRHGYVVMLNASSNENS